MKIKSPDKTYTGESRYGTVVLNFKDGVADHEGKLPPSIRLYLSGAGYGIDADPETVEVPAPADPRTSTLEQVGTPLRDATVDPEPGDFLAPTNAGKPGEEGNPHGPNVVSPELHGSQGVRPVKGGDVHVEDADAQDAVETAHAEQETFEAEAPAGNGSREEWEAYALTQGRTAEELDGLTRNQLRDLFN